MEQSKRAFAECAYKENADGVERHFHNTHEMIYIEEGRAGFEIAGARYEAGPGSLIFISKLEDHTVRVLERPYKRYYLLFTPQQLDRAVEDPRLKAVYLRRPRGFEHIINIPAGGNAALPLFRAILREQSNPGPFSRQFCRSAFQMILIACYRAAGGRFPEQAKQLNPAIPEIQKYLDSHFTENIRLDRLADEFYISQSYLSHCFREWTGDSPKQYIMRSRIALAKELLSGTDLPVSLVSLKCGFGDGSNFIRTFKKETGVTPLSFRRS